MGNLNRVNPSRFHQLALGKFDNFTHKTAGLIGLGDTTPDVSLYSLLWADTTGSLTISYFDNGCEGQLVLLGNLGTGEVDFDGANIVEQASSPIATNEFAAFVNHNSSWYELFRSKADSAQDITTVVGSGDARWWGTSTGGFSATGLSFIQMNSAGKTVIKALSDGRVGQKITVANIGKADLHFCSGSGGTHGTFVNASARTLVIPTSASINATFDGTNWFIDSPTLLGLI